MKIKFIVLSLLVSQFALATGEGNKLSCSSADQHGHVIKLDACMDGERTSFIPCENEATAFVKMTKETWPKQGFSPTPTIDSILLRASDFVLDSKASYLAFTFNDRAVGSVDVIYVFSRPREASLTVRLEYLSPDGRKSLNNLSGYGEMNCELK